MGDSSACPMQPFCYASGISNEANQSNPIHALGESISFGRFMPESLAWDKWSTFSRNRYVEEAERFSRPGSVAQKKAFFEAHYKKLAAQKAAALLGQEARYDTKTEQEPKAVVDNTYNSHMTSPKSKLAVNEENAKVSKSNSNSNIETSLPQINKVGGAQLEMEHRAFVGNSMLVELQNQPEDVDDTHKKLREKVSGITPMDAPKLEQGSNSEQEVLQPTGKKKPLVSSFKLLKAIGISKFTSTPAKSTAPAFSNKDNVASSMSSNKPTSISTDKKRSTRNSLHSTLNFTPVREINRLTASVIRKFESTRVGGSSKASKDSSDLLRSPTKASKNELQRQSSLTPLTETKRNKMTSPFVSSPFSLRTEERVASRKKKLEETFNANEPKVQLHTKLKDKAEMKIRKLRHGFCFKATPLPDFYEEAEASSRETREDPLTYPESPKKGRRSTPSVVECKTSLPPQRPSLKNNATENLQGKNGGTLTLTLTHSTMITTQENTSPNIQHQNRNDRNSK